MREFSKVRLMALMAASSLVLVACNEDKKESETKKEDTTKVESKTEEKATTNPLEEKKSETPAEEAKKKASVNFKLDGADPTEPALTTLEKVDKNAIVARVEGEPITVSDLIEALKASPDQIKALPLSKTYTALTKRLRDMLALVRAAEKDGIDRNDTVEKKVKEAVEAVKVKHFVDEKINAKITPEYLKKQFDEFMKLYMKEGKSEKEFRMMVIIVKDQKSASDVVGRVKKGEKFETLVMSESTDEKVKDTKGDLGYVRFSDFPQDLAEKVAKAATGVMIDTPIKLAEDKWAIFKKTDQRNVPPPTFQEVAPDLKKVVMPQFFGEVLKEVLKDLKSEIIDYKTGSPVDEKAEEAKAEEAKAEEAKAEAAKTEEAGKDAPSKTEAPKADARKTETSTVVQ